MAAEDERGWTKADMTVMDPRQANFQDSGKLFTVLRDLLVVSVLRLRRNMRWQDYASFDSLLSDVGFGHLGKGWIVRGTTTRRLLLGQLGSSYRFTAYRLPLPSTDLT